MRTVFLGTSQFAVAVLRALADSPHRPELVLSRPDAPRGRGRRLASPPVADAARELGIELDQPESVNSEGARERIAAARPEAVCVCAFGALIKEPLLSQSPMINVHPSLLPRWRGAAPIERAIMAGDSHSGVSIMRVTAGLDSGPVYAQLPEPIHPDDTYGRLARRLEGLGARLLVEVLDQLPPPREQPEEGITYAEKISSEDRHLDPAQPAIELERRVRGLSPHVGARLDLQDGTLLVVLNARARPEGPAAEPGSLLEHHRRPLVACGAGQLELLEVRPAGRRSMSGEQWLRGHR